jgi:hypothetical protein
MAKKPVTDVAKKKVVKKTTKPTPATPEAPKKMTKEDAQKIGYKVNELYARFDENADQQKVIIKEMRNLCLHLLSNVK